MLKISLSEKIWIFSRISRSLNISSTCVRGRFDGAYIPLDEKSFKGHEGMSTVPKEHQ